MAPRATIELTTAWPQVIARVRAHGNEPGVRLWLDTPKVRPITIEDGVLVLECPTPIYTRPLSERFGPLIRIAVAEITGVEVKSIRCRIPGTAVLAHERELARVSHAGEPIAKVGPRPGSRLLDDFVVGPCNRLAYDAVRRVLERPENPVNPTFIHGPSGLGKTHLEQGLALAFKERHPKSKVLYVRCEQFTNEFIEACEGGGAALAAFRVRMRHPDLLLIDDIHFLSKGQKEKTKDELFATFDHLANHGKKVVITSDASPKDIQYLEERFVQRFSGGLVVPLERPDLEVRREIIARRAREQGADLPDEAADYVAQHVTDNVRMLEGAVNRLVQFSHSFQRKLDLAAARQCLADLVGRERGEDAAAMVRREVAAHYGLQPNDLNGRAKTHPRATARHVAMYVLRHVTGDTYGAVGETFGLKNHTSVVYACSQVAKMRGQDPEIDGFIADLVLRAKR
ncbi:MAG: DnaA/Hda family protein [Planctomycetota bacterium]